MPTEQGSGVGLSPSPREVLTEAFRRVAGRIDEIHPPLAEGGLARAEGYLATLRAKFVDVLEGQDPVAMRKWLASGPLYAPLMDALLHELISGHSRSPDAANATFAVLEVWYSLRPGATAGGSPRSADELSSRMRGPDAFKLLIEVAHDFRSPLTSILFLSEALRDGHSGPVTDVQRSQLGLIYSAAFGLASIASDVMDLAREGRSLISGGTEPFSLVEVFRSVERMVRPIVEEKRLELRVVVPERWEARGHPHALGRVLLNLTTNALKFTDEGTVEIGVRPVPYGRLEFYVQDTGRGISSEQQRELFQPFRRRSPGPKVGHYFSGSGIGLSIARRLLHEMGSDLTLDSSTERGTRFSFVLDAAARG